MAELIPTLSSRNIEPAEKFWISRFRLAMSGLISGGLWISNSIAATPPCAEGWLSVRAAITRIDPIDAKVTRRHASTNLTSPLVVGTVLCEGDSIHFADPGDGSSVELNQSSQVKRIASASALYVIPKGMEANIQAARAYVDSVMAGVRIVHSPPVPQGQTAGRAPGGVDTASSDFNRRQVHAIRSMDISERQYLTMSEAALVAWRDGRAPYRCALIGEDKLSVWEGSSEAVPWCSVPVNQYRGQRILVHDADERIYGWNIALTTETEIPRPYWLPSGGTYPRGSMRVAWAIWLWERGGPSWRLQALAMLHALAAQEFLASYFVDWTLADAPPVPPRR